MSDTYTLAQVAERLGKSPATIRKWRYAGKIPPPVEDDDFVLRWSISTALHMAQYAPEPAGTYEVEHRVRRKRSAHIQFRGHHVRKPLEERTPEGETLSSTVRWIVEQYLELMATLDAKQTDIYEREELLCDVWADDRARMNNATQESQR